MSKESVFDRRVDKLIGRVSSIQGRVTEMFEGKKPFRIKPISREDRVAAYLSYDPQVIEAMRQQSPEAWGAYESKVLKDMEEMKNA